MLLLAQILVALVALLHPEELRCVPWYTYLDVRVGRFHHRKLRGGNRHPLQRLKSYIARRRLASADAQRKAAQQG